jgi:hypothetical protein
MTKEQQQKINELTPLVKAIRERCLDCCAGNTHEVKRCVSIDCGLYSYRNGLNKICKKSPRKNKEKDENEAIGEWCESHNPTLIELNKERGRSPIQNLTNEETNIN